MREWLASLGMLLALGACSRGPQASEGRAGAPAAAGAPPPSAGAATVQAPPSEGAVHAPTVPAEVAAPSSSATPDAARAVRVGGSCSYEDTAGTATVTAIEAEPANGDCSNQPKRVTLKFVPSDVHAKPEPRDQAFTLGVGGLSLVAAGCLKAYKIALGTQLPTVRHKMTSGTCSPLVYEVKALSSPEDAAKCSAYCSQ